MNLNQFLAFNSGRIQKRSKQLYPAMVVILLLLLLAAVGCESMPSNPAPSPDTKPCPEGQLKTWKDGKSSCVKAVKRGSHPSNPGKWGAF